MSPIEALHTAARRYCMERIEMWHRAYGALGRSRQDRINRGDGSWDYTDEARDVFPRYNVLGAILNEVEQWTLADFASVDEARSLLAVMGESARDQMTRSENRVELAAMQAERDLFVAYVSGVGLSALDAVQPLPYRRVLLAQEAARLAERVAARWGRWHGGECDRADLPPNATIHAAAMQTPQAYDALRTALSAAGVTRLFELREWGPQYHLDLSLASFSYNGAEGSWTDESIEWMVNASHESSVTFGGQWLIDAMRRALPAFDRFIYKGYDLGDYDLPDEDRSRGDR